jgi:hypothetical protein
MSKTFAIELFPEPKYEMKPFAQGHILRKERRAKVYLR